VSVDTSHTTPASSRVPAGASLRAAQVTTVLTLVVILSMGVTGGQLVDRGEGALDLHALSAIVLHVISALAALSLIAYRVSGASRAWWPPVLGVVVFAYSFYQAWLGSHGPIAIHVPGALALTGAAAWLAAWTFLHGRLAPRA